MRGVAEDLKHSTLRDKARHFFVVNKQHLDLVAVKALQRAHNQRFCLVEDWLLPLERGKESCRCPMNQHGVDRLPVRRSRSRQVPKVRQKIGNTQQKHCE